MSTNNSELPLPVPNVPSKKKLTDIEVLSKMGYTLGRKLGEGTYAKVLYAEYIDKKNPKRKIQLACKVISIKTASKSFATKFFPRELSTLCQVEHPYIIRIHSILKETEKFYMFMTYCENGDLLEFIRINGAIREIQCRVWFSQILEGMKAIEYLHGLDIVHRDLKCENILLSNSYKIKIGDFGFTRIYHKGDDLSQTFCGSIMYAPPEVVRGIPYNPKRADLWSIGVILFTMINSSMPFDQNRGLMKLYEDQMKRSWKLRDKIKERITQELRVFLYGLLEPQPEKRISAAELRHRPWIAMGTLSESDIFGKSLVKSRRRSS